MSTRLPTRATVVLAVLSAIPTTVFLVFDYLLIRGLSIDATMLGGLIAAIVGWAYLITFIVVVRRYGRPN